MLIVSSQNNLSYSQTIDTNLQTLSTNDADPSGTIQGLLYVPDLTPDDPCQDLSRTYIPANATRQANLPNEDFNLIGLAPWINANCSQSFLDAGILDPIRALIFYLPDNSTSQPPPISSATWSLNDGGQWKAAHHFPVYAVPGSIGAQMMFELSQYSGNLTNVPFGSDLSEIGFDSRDYARVYTELSIESSSSLPGLWVFLLVVAGALAVILATTSLTMHIVQRRRREALRRRVQSGDVNLEALGIKRLTVPREVIDKMTLFIYTCDEGESSNSAVADETATPKSRATANENKTGSSIMVHQYLPESQPTCPICLDDFMSGHTTIRELPCGHIFHPECIDNFLGNNSSLCPMCKKSALPLGYCPDRITNAMVRRERAIRRLRPRVTIRDDGPVEERTSLHPRTWQLGRLLPRRAGHAIPYTSDDMELGNGSIQEGDIDLGGLQSHQIAHQRVQALLRIAPASADVDHTAEQSRPKWRTIVSRVFPGF